MTPGKPGINSNQFYQTIVDNLRARLNSSHATLLSDLKVLEPDNWPPKNNDGSDGANDTDDGRLLYGEQSVVRMAKRFRLNTRYAVEQFRRFKDGKKPEAELKCLIAAGRTFPGTSAECERGFSTMNDIAWEKRNSLHPVTISNLMFIALNGPPLSTFDPVPYVQP